jgi:3-isopropylmalate dehydrogenase
MRRYQIAVLPGDGIGPEVVGEAMKVAEVVARRAGARLEFAEYEAGAGLYQRAGVSMPQEVYDACDQSDAILLGAIGLPGVRLPDGTEVTGEAVLRLRFGFDLYAGVRPIRLYPGVPSPLAGAEEYGINYVVVRENIEGLYASRGGGTITRDQVATDTIVQTRSGTERIVRYAFELARKRSGSVANGQKTVTCVDKANILRSYVFFRRVFDEVAADYPDVMTDYAYVDAMSLYLVQAPERQDVLVAENMFGDILSDLGAATIGGLGFAPSADIGDHHGLFQPSHGTAPDIAGQGIANPIATILSAGMMLTWLGERDADGALVEAGEAVERAVAQVIAQPRHRTPDAGGAARTTDVGDAVANALV